MMGLIQKDLYTISKQSKILFLMVVLYATLPGSQIFGCAIFIASMIPVTALGYDERVKWNKLAAMMPYSDGEITFSKYIIGYLFVGGVAVIAGVSGYITSALEGGGNAQARLFSVLFFASGALCIQAINLPLMFWMGVEKGRIFFILFTIACMFLVSYILVGENEKGVQLYFSGGQDFRVLILVLAATVMINLISILVSKKVYRKEIS